MTPKRSWPTAAVRTAFFPTRRWRRSARAERRHRLVGKNAVRTAAVGHDLLGVIELREASFKLAQWNVHRTGQMSKRKFVRRPDIEDGDHARARFFQKLLARDGLHTVAVVEVAADHALHFGDVPFGDPAQRRHEAEHGLVGKCVKYELTSRLQFDCLKY